MAHKTSVLALSIIAAASTASPASAHRTEMTAAPGGNLETKYCMHIEAFTGGLVEQVRCWTRDEWAEQGVDVDRDWAENGVRAIG
ncbi:MAG: hypothetical protein H0X36_06610 [Sphingomonadaceae bacterium]|nr:hypothetical protein [Sphingomonadaceae bacterium]